MRRELRFQTLDDARAELDRLEKGPVETTGNWSYFQILAHCAKAINASMRGFSTKKSWFLRRLVGPLALRKVFKQGFIPAGAVSSAKGVSVQRVEGDEKAILAELKKLINEFEGYNGPLAEHPFFGKLNKKQWTRLAVMHLANHLGYAKPKE